MWFSPRSVGQNLCVNIILDGAGSSPSPSPSPPGPGRPFPEIIAYWGTMDGDPSLRGVRPSFISQGYALCAPVSYLRFLSTSWK